jgi:hypothetical protein
MSLSQRQQTFTIMVANIILYALQEGFGLTFGEVYRTQAQQDIYVEKEKSEVTHSKHQDRLAVDFNLFIDGDYVTDKEQYRKLGEQWEKDGGRWGGRFGVKPQDYDTKVGWDAGHFEYVGE